MTVRKRIGHASETGNLVRVHREGLEDGWAEGYIAAAGPKFFALELVSKSIRFDGFNCMRYADVTKFENPAPNANFINKALIARKLCRNEIFSVDMSNLPSLLQTAASEFPILTIHTECSDPDVCFIGRYCEISRSNLGLILVTPDAKWEKKVSWFNLREITRVDFGGDYEEALLLVARAPH